MRVRIFGAGRIGQAAARRCLSSGFDIRLADLAETEELAVDPAAGGLALLALTHGTQVGDLLTRLRGVDAVLDLTTQSSTSAAVAAATADRCGLDYFGGGLTGGAAQLAGGTAVLLVGPWPAPEPVRAVLDVLGSVIGFESAEQGARAKMLHNAYLLMQQSLLALLGGGRGRLDADGLLRVLSTGTAGRPLAESSLVRDLTAETPASSYRNRLVVKDLAEIERELSDLPPYLLELLADLRQRFAQGAPDEPFTQVLKEIFLDAAPA